MKIFLVILQSKELPLSDGSYTGNLDMKDECELNLNKNHLFRLYGYLVIKWRNYETLARKNNLNTPLQNEEQIDHDLEKLVTDIQYSAWENTPEINKKKKQQVSTTPKKYSCSSERKKESKKELARVCRAPSVASEN